MAGDNFLLCLGYFSSSSSGYKLLNKFSGTKATELYADYIQCRFGYIFPIETFSIDGKVIISTDNNQVEIIITAH